MISRVIDNVSDPTMGGGFYVFEEHWMERVMRQAEVTTVLVSALSSLAADEQ